MIYQFRSKAGPDVIMMADLTKRIFDILGRPLESRGILMVEQLPALITTLETAILKDLEERSKTQDETKEEAEKPKLADRLGRRARRPDLEGARRPAGPRRRTCRTAAALMRHNPRRHFFVPAASAILAGAFVGWDKRSAGPPEFRRILDGGPALRLSHPTA